MWKYVLALDQGTTSSRAIVFDRYGITCASAAQEFTQYYPQPGWVEHDPEEIWRSQLSVAQKALAEADARPEDVAAIGITNQRETVVLWDRETGRPLSRAIVWQCRRTAARCEQIRRVGFDQVLREKTGLETDAYFSGTKIAWLLDNIPGARERAERGELACGTIDTWLIWKMTGGRTHATDVSNASRTLLFNIHTLTWDAEILRYFRIPASLLAEVHSSSGILGETALFGGSIPLAGVAGDQQASLFGHQCFRPGDVKNTYGTGCFLLMNTGPAVPRSKSGLLSTVGWRRNGATTYALEGSVFIAGAALQWLRDELQVIQCAAESETMALAVPDTGGVYFVPAFVGLGAPYWDPYARGILVGLTRGTTRAHIARAALEAIAYQSRDVLDTMTDEADLRIEALRIDGGASANDFLCQFQADVLNADVLRPAVIETTGLGAAYLAGVGAGIWKTTELAGRWKLERRFTPTMTASAREEGYAGWRHAVERSRARV